MNGTIREDIRKAALMMDAEIPGWYKFIDLQEFHIQDCFTCVLGQVFGGKMEDKLREILGDKTPVPTEEGPWGTGYGRGLSYMHKVGYTTEKYPIKNVFSGDRYETCVWVEEIAERLEREGGEDREDGNGTDRSQ